MYIFRLFHVCVTDTKTLNVNRRLTADLGLFANPWQILFPFFDKKRMYGDVQLCYVNMSTQSDSTLINTGKKKLRDDGSNKKTTLSIISDYSGYRYG